MAVFFRINNNILSSAGDVERVGFTEDQGFYIPDEYIEKQEFVVMRTCHGIGDWAIISAMPRLLKSKYPKCKVYVPSSTMLKRIFGPMLTNWGYGMFDAATTPEIVFKNNPFVDKFIDEYEGEIYHDHYRIFDETNSKIPLVEQMLKFWQFDNEDLENSSPDIFFSDEEVAKGLNVIMHRCKNNIYPYGYLALTSTFGNTSGNSQVLVDKVEEYSYIKNWFYYGEIPFKDTGIDFLDNVIEVKNLKLPLRIQMFLKTHADVNIGNETGTNLWSAKYSESFVLSHKKYGKIHGPYLENKPRKDPFKSGNFVKNVNYI